MRGNTRVLRSTNDEDLLSVPDVCLGFSPKESCVVIGIRVGHVEFCARTDFPWIDDGLEQLSNQVLNAVVTTNCEAVVLLGYTDDPRANQGRVVSLATALAPWVERMLIATTDRYWDVTPEGLEPPEGLPWVERATSLAASAVYHGVHLAADREAVVAEVRPVKNPELAEKLTAQARRRLACVPDQGRHARLQRLLRTHEPLPPGKAAELALLVQDATLAGAVLRSLSKHNAYIQCTQLARARRYCTPELAPDVLALLALACWFDLRAAQHTDCLVQLQDMAPQHPLLPLLVGIHLGAVPPPRDRPEPVASDSSFM